MGHPPTRAIPQNTLSTLEMGEKMKKTVLAIGSLALLLSSLSPIALGQAVECPPGCSPGRWSARAIDLSSERTKAPERARNISIYSSDRHKIIRVVKEQWWVEDGARRLEPGQHGQSQVLYPAEIAWAPDNNTFFLTQSIGYTTGYYTEVYRIKDTRVERLGNVNPTVMRAFAIHHDCKYFDKGVNIGSKPNIAGLNWMQDSDRLLMVAEVPPISICQQMGYFGGYMVSISSGKILERYSPQQLIDHWEKVLGDRLKSDFAHLSPAQKVAIP